MQTTCTSAGWANLEKAGCIFLPVTGNRLTNGNYDGRFIGMYWSSDIFSNSENMCYNMRFEDNATNVSCDNAYYRNAGLAVRLVKDI